MKVIAIHPGDGELLRIDGMLLPQGDPASVVIHTSNLSLTFVRARLAKDEEAHDQGLQIGFVIFDELEERQKARYSKSAKKPKKFDLTKPFGLPTVRRVVTKKTSPAKKKKA